MFDPGAFPVENYQTVVRCRQALDLKRRISVIVPPPVEFPPAVLGSSLFASARTGLLLQCFLGGGVFVRMRGVSVS